MSDGKDRKAAKFVNLWDDDWFLKCLVDSIVVELKGKEMYGITQGQKNVTAFSTGWLSDTFQKVVRREKC